MNLPNNLTEVLRGLADSDLSAAALELAASSSALQEARAAVLAIDFEIERDPSRDPDGNLLSARGAAEQRMLGSALPMDSPLALQLARDLIQALQSEPPDRTLLRARVWIDELEAFDSDTFDLDLRRADLTIIEESQISDAPWARLAEWMKADFSAVTVERQLSSQRVPTIAYLSYLTLWYWRILVVGYAVVASAGVGDTGPLLARSRLSVDGAASSARALEPFTTSTQLFIDDESSRLDPADESFLRAELEIIRSQHRVIEGADIFYLRRAIGRIVGRLLDLQIVGVHARQLLLELEAEPPELVDKIVGDLHEFMKVVAEQWPAEGLDPAVTPAAAAEPLIAAGAAAAEVVSIESRIPGLKEEALRKFVLGIPDGAGKAVGGGAVGLAGALALSVAKMPGIDAIVLWLIEALPRLLDLYTYRRSDR